MNEEVLVFRASLLEDLGAWIGFTNEVGRYLPTLLNAENLLYLPRAEAETNVGYKQLVPYAVLRCNDEFFTYRRSKHGGESRLHDLWSIGVGGHVCRQDGAVGVEAYETGFRRELDEEVAIQGGFGSSIVGLVHDPRTPVGRVHVGVVHLLDLDSVNVAPRDPALSDAAFRNAAWLAEVRDRMETWSQFVWDGIASG